MVQVEQQTMTLRIDGREITALRGATILEAATANGIYIPTLCYDERLKAYGACRMCLVTQDGRPGMPASCVTPAAPDASYRTNTDEVLEVRRSVLNLLMSEHPHGCLTCDRIVHCGPNDICLRNVSVTNRCVVCPQNQRCDLQATVEITGVTETLLPFSYRELPVRSDDPFIDRDYNLCIACARCVRVCDEVIGAEAISRVDRGDRILPGTPNDVSLSDPLSGCIFCGMCVDVCPVGALTERENKWAGLPDETVTTVCTQCEINCQLKVEMKDWKVLRVIPDIEGGPNTGLACVRGKFQLTDGARREDRLLLAHVRGADGTLSEVSFEEAIAAGAQGFRAHGGRAFAVVASTARSNEDSYLLAKLARDGLGSENVAVTNTAPSQARSELATAFGLGTSTNPIEDIAVSKSVLLVGADIEVTHPVAAFQVHKAANYEDASLIGIGPERYPELGRAASVWLSCLPGAESQVIQGLLATIVQEDLLSDDAGSDLLDGRDELLSTLRGVDVSAIAEETGVDVEELRKAARLFAAAGTRASAIFAPRENDSPGTANALAQLIAITGNIGHEKSGLHVFPIGGGNAEGAADVGLANGAQGGLMAVFDRIEDGSVTSLYWEGGLPEASILPEARLRDALGRLEFMVYQGTAPEPVLLEFANVVIPEADATEYDGTYTNAERRVQRARPIVPAQQDVQPVWAVAVAIGKALGAEGFDHSDAGSVFGEIAARIPEYHGLSYSALDDQAAGPTRPLEGDGVLYRDGFAHADGKARLAPMIVG